MGGVEARKRVDQRAVVEQGIGAGERAREPQWNSAGRTDDDQAGQASCWASWAFPRAVVDKWIGQVAGGGTCWGKGPSASNCHVKKTNKQKLSWRR